MRSARSRSIFVLAVGVMVAVIAVAGPAIAKGPGNGNGHNGGGGTTGGGSSTVTVSPAAPYSFAEWVTITTDAPVTSSSWITEMCYQNGAMVGSSTHAGFPGGWGYNTPFQLGPSQSWSGGAASCTFTALHQANGKDVIDGTASILVSG